MERWVLILCHERPELAYLQEKWQKDGMFVRIVSDAGEAVGELLREMVYLLIIIFSDGKSIYLH